MKSCEYFACSKFDEFDQEIRNHKDAVASCDSKGMRLPTFDEYRVLSDEIRDERHTPGLLIIPLNEGSSAHPIVVGGSAFLRW